MAGDPVMRLLHSLDDPTKFAVERGVPIWEPHTRSVTNPDGTTTKVTVRESDLQDYADRINELFGRKGYVGRITDRHVQKPTRDNPSPPNPKLVGFYKSARVGTYGPESLPAVLVDCYYFRDRLDVVRDCPNRSVEVYTGPKEIRGLALLAGDAYLDMGTVVTFSQPDQPLHYGSDYMAGEAMGPANAAPAAPAGGAPAPATQAPAPKPAGAVIPPEEEAQYAKAMPHILRHVRQCYGLPEHWPGPEKAPEPKAAEGPAAPAPGEGDKPKGEVTPMSKPETPTDYARKVAELTATVAGLQLEREHERCNALLYGLEAEGYRFSKDDRDEELKTLVSKDEAGKKKHVERMRRLYEASRAPRGMVQVYGGPVEGGAPDESDPFGVPWFHEPATAYMTAHPGTSYAAAVEHVKDKAGK